MKKFEGMLFCTDLDGTLYTTDKKVSRENLEAIEYFKSEGGIFTFITGRAHLTATDVYEIIRPNGPFGCFNGGAIYDFSEKKFLWKELLPPQYVEILKDVDRELPEIGIQVNTEKAIYFNKDNLALEYFRKITGTEYLFCPYDQVNEPVTKVLFAHHQVEQIARLQEFLDNHPLKDLFSFSRTGKSLYELIPKNISKGVALKKLSELLNIDIKKTVAVGDYNNDVSMIEAAGIGFAVENAVEEAKAVADHITVKNDEHAIKAIIEGLDKGRYL